MELLAPYPDIEEYCIVLLDSIAPGKVYQTTPENFEPPAIRVWRVGGTDRGFTDRPVVLISTFGKTYAQAKLMAELCRQKILACSGTALVVPGYVKPVLIDYAQTITPPVEVQSTMDAASGADVEKRRKLATYQFDLRRQS